MEAARLVGKSLQEFSGLVWWERLAWCVMAERDAYGKSAQIQMVSASEFVREANR